MNTTPKLILASISPRRKELLEKTGIPFSIIPSSYEEDMSLNMTPQNLAKFLSAGKALDVAKKHPKAVVIGADTFVVYKDKHLGKPHTLANAKKTLRMLSGKAHTVVTGFTIMHLESGKKISKAITTKVYFKKLSSSEINNYLAIDNPLEAAGSYTVQSRGWMLIEKIEGDYNNVVGLPLFALAEELKKFGIQIL